jgi:hypothetical protein
MKKMGLVLVSALSISTANGQSAKIIEVFRLMPAEKIYDLTVATRDSMLQGKTYYPAGNDSDAIEAYNYGISPKVENYLYVSFSYETAQRGSGMIEIRSFTTTTSEDLIMVSKTGGVWQVAYHQHDVAFFKYGKSKKLVQSRQQFLPVVDETIFMKPGIPDSVKKIIMNNSNMTYDLSKERIILSLNSDYLLNYEVSKKWLKGDAVYVNWVKDRFIIGGFVNSGNR